MKYILDFDHTLLDTDAFVARVDQDDRRPILITPGIWQHYDVRSFLYTDVLDWLQSKPKESLHILTAMTPELGPLSCEFQKTKLRSGAFDSLVASTTFMIGEKGEAAAEIAAQFSPHETIVFVDDKLEQCLSVQAALPQAICCLIVRDVSQAVSTPSAPGIHVVHTLADVDGILNLPQNKP